MWGWWQKNSIKGSWRTVKKSISAIMCTQVLMKFGSSLASFGLGAFQHFPVFHLKMYIIWYMISFWWEIQSRNWWRRWCKCCTRTPRMHCSCSATRRSVCTGKSGFPGSRVELWTGRTLEVRIPTWKVGWTSVQNPTWLFCVPTDESCSNFLFLSTSVLLGLIQSVVQTGLSNFYLRYQLVFLTMATLARTNPTSMFPGFFYWHVLTSFPAPTSDFRGKWKYSIMSWWARWHWLWF